MKVKIKEIQDLLSQGKIVKVKTINGEYTKISRYVDKGILDTFLVKLDNKLEIKVSREHKFFTNCGWVECKDLIIGEHSILCEDGTYSKIISSNLIGKGPIVDITVEHPEHCYFGNGMLNHNTGKSLIVAHALAETQRKGGLAILFDTETALSKEYLTAIGVDISKLLVISLDTVEDIFDSIESMITKIRSSNKNKLVTIVIDSVAAMSTKSEQDESFAKEGYGTAKAYLLSKAFRKITSLIGKQRILFICTNQLREKIGFVGLGDKFQTPCGKALPFHASVRIRLKSTGQILNSDKVVIGMKTEAKVVKNRMGPPFRKAEFNVFFDRGIDNYGNWIERLIDYDVISPFKPAKVDADGKKKTKAELALEKEASKKDKNLKFDVIAEDGVTITETVVFEKKDFLKVISARPELKEYLYAKLCDKYIFKYSDPNVTRDEEVEISDESEE